MCSAHVVVVDDEPIQRQVLHHHLREENYRVSEAANAQQLDAILATQPVDLLLLDVMMPGRDGLSITQDLRLRSDLAIILVTRRNKPAHRILGLELGADDYIVKPYLPQELLARVRAVLRRRLPLSAAAQIVTIGDWHFDRHNCTLTSSQGETRSLSRNEHRLLGLLVRHAGQPVSRDQLTQTLHPDDGTDPNSRRLDALVGRLRVKLGDDPKCPCLIVTHHGKGYRLTNAQT